MTRLLIGMTGSLGILAMPPYLMAFREFFPEIKIIMTHTATRIIPKESFSMFADGIYTSDFPLSRDNMGHIELARWADLFIVLPATAHMLSEAACGAAASLLTATILAYEKGVIFFPNMNSAMWNKPSVKRNISLLIEDGHKVISALHRPAFEYASREVEMNHVMPTLESVLSIVKLEVELKK